MTLLDTADMYGPFTNEELVGKAIRRPARRGRLATKFGIVRRRRTASWIGINGRPEYVRAGLRRLAPAARRSTHRPLLPAPRRSARRRSRRPVGAMAELVRQGKVRYLGLSEAAPATIRRAHAVHPISALQYRVLALEPRPRGRGPPRCRELGIGFVAVQPARPRLPHRPFKRGDDLRRTTSASTHPALPGREPAAEPGARRPRQRDRERRRTRRRRSSRSPGSSPRATTSCRSPGRSASVPRGERARR